MTRLEARLIVREIANNQFNARMARCADPGKSRRNAERAERKRLEALRLTVLALAPEIVVQ